MRSPLMVKAAGVEGVPGAIALAAATAT